MVTFGGDVDTLTRGATPTETVVFAGAPLTDTRIAAAPDITTCGTLAETETTNPTPTGAGIPTGASALNTT